MNRTTFIAIAPLLVAAACAPRATRVAADTGPRLIGCSGFQPNLPRSTDATSFGVRVKVDKHGNVVPGSGDASSSLTGPRKSTAGALEARSMAETCTFEPAMRNGLAVESRALVRVVVPQAGI